MIKNNVYDVIIVGAGASGLTAAWNLSNEKLKILCIDQGPKINTNFLKNNLEWSKKKEKYFDINPNKRNLKSDYPINDKNSEISLANFNAIGGSTIIYSGHFPRFHPSDFKVKSLDKCGKNWPISYKELEPFYSKNEKIMGISGLSGDPAYPDKIKNLLPPVNIGKSGELIAKSFNKLGWHWWPSYSAIITSNKLKRKKFKKNAHYNMSYPYSSRSSVDNTYLQLIKKNKITIKENTRAIKITLENRRIAKGVLCKNQNNKKIFYKAKLIILACSGAGTPRLLLNSKNKYYPKGLANSSGMVGKNLMLHPLGFVEGIFDKNLFSNIGPHGCNIYSHEFYETNKKNDFKRGYTIQVLRSDKAINIARNLHKFNKLKFGKKFHQNFLNHYGKTIPVAIICEDLPKKENRIELDYNNKDSDSMPGIKVFYKLSKNTKKILSDGIKNVSKLMINAGAKKILRFGPVKHTGWHIMGTASMGLDKKKSVVNKNGFTHDIKNLAIVDSSIFPTSGAVNPVSTIQAMSLKITNYIKKNKRKILNEL